MTREEYNVAFDRIKELKAEIESLENQILLYENEHLVPEYYTQQDVREFLAFELPPVGKLFKYNDEMHIVVLDIEEMLNEYGGESSIDAILEEDFNKLYDGNSIGVIDKVK